MVKSPTQLTAIALAKLPPELLRMIFYHLALDLFYTSATQSEPARPVPLGWAVVTHVCRYWRDVALADARLWGYGIFHNRRWADESTLRSRDAPLYIRTPSNPFLNSPDAVRLREAYMANPRVLLDFAHDPVELEVLEVGPPSVYDGSNLFITFTFGLKFRYSSFAYPFCAAPSLRRLRLCHREFFWDVIASSNLTFLHIELPRSFHDVINTRAEALSALKHLQTLETLILINSMPLKGTDPPGTAHPVVSLPALSKITLIDNPEPCAWFLSRLEIPTSACVALCCDSDTDYDSFPSLLRLLSAHSTRLSESQSEPDRLISLCIDIYSNQLSPGCYIHGLHVKAWRSPHTFSDMPESMHTTKTDASIAFSFELGPRLESSFALLYHTLLDSTFDLRHVRTLRVAELYHCRWASDWLELLPKFHSLESISVEWSAADPFIRTLAANKLGRNYSEFIDKPIWSYTGSPSPKLVGPNAPPIVLPNLQHITLADTCLDPADRPEGWLVYDVVLRTLAARRALQSDGKKLSLTIRGCVVEPGAVRKLWEALPDVRWDGDGRLWERSLESSDESDWEFEDQVEI